MNAHDNTRHSHGTGTGQRAIPTENIPPGALREDRRVGYHARLHSHALVDLSDRSIAFARTLAISRRRGWAGGRGWGVGARLARGADACLWFAP